MAIVAAYNGRSLDGKTVGGAFAGHTDWRLPTIAELSTILEVNAAGCGFGGPCIHPDFGPTGAGLYWSSTLTPVFDFVWFTDFSTGRTQFLSPLETQAIFRYRVVRTGP